MGANDVDMNFVLALLFLCSIVNAKVQQYPKDIEAMPVARSPVQQYFSQLGDLDKPNRKNRTSMKQKKIMKLLSVMKKLNRRKSGKTGKSTAASNKLDGYF